MACWSSCSPTDFELQLAACAGLRSLDSFISLFSSASSSSFSSSSSVQLQQQHQQSMAAATDTINKFKHIGTLLSQRKGHARVRQAPGIAVSAAPLSDTMRDSANLSRNKPNLGNPNVPSCASESFEFSQIGLPASCHGTGSTSFEECDSVNFEYHDDGLSVRGGSHIDLNQYHHDNSDYYEGSVNQFSMRGCYTQHIKARDCPIITNNYHNQSNNYSFSAKISDNYPSSFDLNQEAPSLADNSSSSLTSSVQYKPPINGLGSKYNCDMPPSRPLLYCSQPISAFPPPSQDQSFSFDARAQSAATALALPVPSASDTPSAVPSSDEDEFAELANKPTDLYEGAHSLINRQLAKIFATNPNLEAHLEKAACMIPTPTRSHISCISLEGNMTANGGLPPVQGPQSAVASMDQKGNSGGKRKCPSINSDDSKLTQCGNNPSKCHCSKRRKLKNKSIKRVPAISDKIAEIPHDDYSWRKYGQKPIKGSPYPRGYYKCSGVKGCPAKKHVERALDDPTMLIITYEGEHIHSKPYSEESLQI